ncbi:methyl-accepting chemotaxis protein [Halomonas vilamensis]|uniref:Methyl-accepting chemotaxis protein n=1 Tax=Vreelandella vilamensis TaxID=531309 RepID=A0ABU1H748_9GAMM|nr:methyl-accepting chemotaxis protein [Halomonas vilamensis]MDR5900116.1 methyl-accepting chemotaxis protein [Halomonas vilamensis]
MLKFSRLKVRNRLMIGFGALLVIFSALTVVGIDRVNTIDQRLYMINDVNGQMMRHAINFRGSVHDRAIALRDITLVSDTQEVNELVELHDRLANNYRQAENRLNDMFENYPETITEREQEMLADINRIAQRGRDFAQEIINERRDGDFISARETVVGEGGDTFAEWLDAINVFIDYQEAESAADTTVARSVADNFSRLMITLTVIALVLGIGIAVFISRQLVKELGAEPKEVRAFAQAVGQGDLTAKPHVAEGDTSSIMATLSGMANQLRDLVTQVQHSASTVASKSQLISENNNGMASSMEQQASALAETASAMEELHSTVEQNADNSQQASKEANGATTTARRGGESVNQVTETMKALSESSQEIAGIISTIDSIAFQTNILALNASVEAARAGEHGRGFAVVAQEVRKLAQRSAEAASEITLRITSNLERVKDGDKQAEEASQATEEIIDAIERVTSIMQEISNASAEQSKGVGEVNDAVTDMDRVTQRNALNIQEGAQSATQLQDHADDLLSAVERFKLPEDRQAPALPVS